MTAYYNEIDPYAAQWLRSLITAGHIAPGIVDQRSIEDVRPSDLGGFTQCHFFAGIGVWSLALRRAGWADDRPIWTGSCPCQPFSAAGAGNGFADERHLWPAFHWLIEQCRPAVILGEQVASKDADTWVDLVQADMEGMAYAFGAVPFPSAGIGAPHIRDRLYWVAHANSARSFSSAQRGVHRGKEGAGARNGEPERFGATGGMADSADIGFDGRGAGQEGDGRYATRCESERLRDAIGLADTDRAGREQRGSASAPAGYGNPAGADGRIDRIEPAGPTNGFWRDADWILCRDGKFRPVEPGTQPLADGPPARVGRLRAYGNAINAIQAQIFIEEVMECMPTGGE